MFLLMLVGEAGMHLHISESALLYELTYSRDQRGGVEKPRKAYRVLKYTDVTLVFKTLSQSSTDSPRQIVSCNSCADVESGGALGPEMPAFVTVRLRSVRLS